METQSLPLTHTWPHGPHGPHGLMPVGGVRPASRGPHRARRAELVGLAVGLTVFFGVATWRWRAPPTPILPAATPAVAPPVAAVTAQMEHDGTPHAPLPAAAVDPPPAPESAPPPMQRHLPRPPAAAIPGDFEVPSFPLPEESVGIDHDAAATAVAVAARRAAACLEPDDLRTTMAVSVVFAPSGQATHAVLRGGPFLGTETGSCIAAALRTARVGPFEGGPVTVNATARIR